MLAFCNGGLRAKTYIDLEKFSLWIAYICLRRLPARDLVQTLAGEYTAEGAQDFRGCFILNTCILCCICSKTAKQYVGVWDGGMEGGICGRVQRKGEVLNLDSPG